MATEPTRRMFASLALLAELGVGAASSISQLLENAEFNGQPVNVGAALELTGQAVALLAEVELATH